MGVDVSCPHHTLTPAFIISDISECFGCAVLRVMCICLRCELPDALLALGASPTVALPAAETVSGKGMC